MKRMADISEVARGIRLLKAVQAARTANDTDALRLAEEAWREFMTGNDFKHAQGNDR